MDYNRKIMEAKRANEPGKLALVFQTILSIS